MEPPMPPPTGEPNILRLNEEERHIYEKDDTIVCDDFSCSGLDAFPGKTPDLPTVSILVATRNRRPYITQLVRCISTQSYPSQNIEVIIGDDGEQPIGDLLPKHYRYIYWNKRIPLGRKRHELTQSSHGDIIVIMDDDDYYPATRVSHSVETLQKNKVDFVFAPSFYTLNKHTLELKLSGPWYKNWPHATFAFTRAFKDQHAYDLNAQYAEERVFTNFYRVPYAILEPKKTIVVLIHNGNTIPKNRLGKSVPSRLGLQHLIQDPRSMQFYRSLKYSSMGPYQA